MISPQATGWMKGLTMSKHQTASTTTEPTRMVASTARLRNVCSSIVVPLR